MIELQGVSVTYGLGATVVRAARDVSFRIPAGDALGLVGESGSGKSTVLRAVAAICRTSSGSSSKSAKLLASDFASVTVAAPRARLRLRSRVPERKFAFFRGAGGPQMNSRRLWAARRCARNVSVTKNSTPS